MRPLHAFLLTLPLAGAVLLLGARPIPEAAARRAAERWEYKCVDGWAGVTHSANQLGAEGWEMAAGAGTSDHMMWCFKRRLP
ncbi:MAG: hypothetical protein FJ104_10110 [Deltaproteobacteria bacterium]|nr:hypothetical protein [Deltaproteobacteria bacterium]